MTSRALTRLAAFSVGLLLVVVAGYVVGQAVTHSDNTTTEARTLDISGDRSRAPGTSQLTFSVRDADGRAITSFQRRHQRLSHLIIVRDDLTGFQHLHPRLGSSGRWSVPLTIAEPGKYLLYVDVDPKGSSPATVRSTLSIAGGPVRAKPLPEPSTVSRIDGLTTTIAHDPIVVGEPTRITLTVNRTPATTPQPRLQPYLGAMGHAVVISTATKSYMHVHPVHDTGGHEHDSGAPNTTAFDVTFTERGQYRSYIQFRLDDKVHTAEFTLSVAPSDSGTESHDSMEHAGH